jgi:hypothetical protein
MYFTFQPPIVHPMKTYHYTKCHDLTLTGANFTSTSIERPQFWNC